MDHISVYKFKVFSDYLAVVKGSHLGTSERRLSLQAFSKKLGYKSPRSIAMVLKGQRLPSHDMLDRISTHLQHSEAERRYLSLIVKLARANQKQQDPRPILNELERLHPHDFGEQTIDSKSFSYIAEWYHFAIKQLVDTRTFKPKPAWIAKRLRSKISESNARKAMGVLETLGIIKKDNSGRFRVMKARITTSQGIPDQALRLHHKGMISRALEAVDEKDFANREITSVTLRIDPRKVDVAKKMIRTFRDEFHKQMEAKASEHVYQMNFQLFELTEP